MALPSEGRGVIEMPHEGFMAKDGVVLRTFLMQQGPVLTRSPWQWQISGFEVSSIEEYCSSVRMLPVLSLIGEVTLILASVSVTCL